MEVVGSIYTEVSDRFQKGIIGEGISRCVKAEKHDLGVIMADVNVIGSLDAKFESTNRIYDVGGSSTLSTMQDGNQEPKILESKQLGFMDNGTGKHQSNTVYDENALCPNITTVEGGGTQQIKVCESQIVAMRGRNPDNPSDRTVGSLTEQRLEVNMQGTSNCLTSVQKDNLLLEKPQYRIRKLTPRECGRLMGVSDEDIDKMAAVNSNTQLYKQFGNSIVVDIMCAMFENLNINQGGTV
jgi:site-specific DNA-cytosine methylase